MKRSIFAVCAALLLLSACGAEQNSSVSQAEPSAAVQQVPDVTVQPSISAQTPVFVDPVEPASDETEVSFLDEPELIQKDLDEVVSYTFRIPRLTLATDEASQTINDGFSALLASLEDYAADTVYLTAIASQAIAFVDGNYTLSQKDGVITLSYTVSVRYGADGEESVEEKSYQFDAATGARLVS